MPSLLFQIRHFFHKATFWKTALPALLISGAFGKWFATQQIASLAPAGHYPPGILMLQTGSIVAMMAFIPYGYGSVYAQRAGMPAARFLYLLGLLPLLGVFAGLPLPWALNASLLVFTGVTAGCHMMRGPSVRRTLYGHALALSLIILMHVLFNGYFSPLQLPYAISTAPEDYPAVPALTPLLRLVPWIKQFSLSLLGYNEWLIAPATPTVFSAPVLQLMALMMNTPSIDTMSFYRLLHWFFFFSCILESFGFYLLLKAGLRINWSLSAAFGMVCIFAQRPLFIHMIAYDNVVGISTQVVFPFALCLMICALRQGSVRLASFAGASLAASFILFSPHPDFLLEMLVVFGTLSLSAAIAMPQTWGWKGSLRPLAACLAWFILLSAFQAGILYFPQANGELFTKGHVESLHADAGLSSRLLPSLFKNPLAFSDSIYYAIGLTAFLVLTLKVGRRREMIFPAAALMVILLLAPDYSPLMMAASRLIYILAHIEADLDIYYRRREYFIALCALLLASLALDRVDFIGWITQKLKRLYGGKGHAYHAQSLLLAAAVAVCIYLQTGHMEFGNPRCPYYLTLEALLANYPLLSNDVASQEVIQDRLQRFEQDIKDRKATDFISRYDEILKQSGIRSADAIKDASRRYNFARGAAPLIDRFYLDKSYNCVHPAEGVYNIGKKEFMLPNSMSLYSGLPSPFLRIASFTEGEDLSKIAAARFSGYLSMGSGPGLFINNDMMNFDARFMVGSPLLHALYLYPGYDYAPLGTGWHPGFEHNQVWALPSGLLFNPLYRKLLDISGIDVVMTSSNHTPELAQTAGFEPLPQNRPGAIESLDELTAMRNTHSYGMAYLANRAFIVSPSVIAPMEQTLRRNLIHHDSEDAYRQARNFLYAKLDELKGYRDIILEEPAPASEGVAPGSVAISNIVGEATVMKANCERKECVLVYNMAKTGGWKAYSDGAPLRIQRANFAFLAVTLPQGVHEVWFVYAPLSSFLLAILSLLAWNLLPFAHRKQPFKTT